MWFIHKLECLRYKSSGELFIVECSIGVRLFFTIKLKLHYHDTHKYARTNCHLLLYYTIVIVLNIVIICLVYLNCTDFLVMKLTLDIITCHPFNFSRMCFISFYGKKKKLTNKFSNNYQKLLFHSHPNRLYQKEIGYWT